MNTTCPRDHHSQERLFSTNAVFVGGGEGLGQHTSWNLHENKHAVPDLSHQGKSPNGGWDLFTHTHCCSSTTYSQFANSGKTTKDTNRRRRPRSGHTNSLTRRPSWIPGGASSAGPQSTFWGASVQQPATLLLRPGWRVRPGTYDSLTSGEAKAGAWGASALLKPNSLQWQPRIYWRQTRICQCSVSPSPTWALPNSSCTWILYGHVAGGQF